jgi:hypothetical protein
MYPADETRVGLLELLTVIVQPVLLGLHGELQRMAGLQGPRLSVSHMKK